MEYEPGEILAYLEQQLVSEQRKNTYMQLAKNQLAALGYLQNTEQIRKLSQYDQKLAIRTTKKWLRSVRRITATQAMDLFVTAYTGKPKVADNDKVTISKLSVSEKVGNESTNDDFIFIAGGNTISPSKSRQTIHDILTQSDFTTDETYDIRYVDYGSVVHIPHQRNSQVSAVVTIPTLPSHFLSNRWAIHLQTEYTFPKK